MTARVCSRTDDRYGDDQRSSVAWAARRRACSWPMMPLAISWLSARGAVDWFGERSGICRLRDQGLGRRYEGWVRDEVQLGAQVWNAALMPVDGVADLTEQLQRFVNAGRPAFRIEGTLDFVALRRFRVFSDAMRGLLDADEAAADAVERTIEEGILKLRPPAREAALCQFGLHRLTPLRAGKKDRETRAAEALDSKGWSWFARTRPQSPPYEGQTPAAWLIGLVARRLILGWDTDRIDAIAGVARLSGFRVQVRRGTQWEGWPAGHIASADQIYSLLGIGGRIDLLNYRVAGHHPLYDIGDPHPDDRAALVAVARHGLKSLSGGAPTLTLVDRCQGSLADGLCLVGSPEAEIVSRLVFDYVPRRDGQGMRYLGKTLDLPYRWQEDATAVTATYARYVEGRGKVSRPNWPIIDQRNSTHRSIFPAVDNDGFLASDLLLITKLPNFLSADALERGRSIVSIAGSHGTATRSVDIFLRDEVALRTVAQRLPADAQAFQVLLEAGDMIHQQAGSRARAVRVLDVQDLTRGDSEWISATKRVKLNYKEWRHQSRLPGVDGAGN